MRLVASAMPTIHAHCAAAPLLTYAMAIPGGGWIEQPLIRQPGATNQSPHKTDIAATYAIAATPQAITVYAGLRRRSATARAPAVNVRSAAHNRAMRRGRVTHS